MHGRCQIARAVSTNFSGWLTALCTVASFLLVCPLGAQTLDGFSQPVTFKIANATSHGPGAVERLTIDYITARPNNIVDVRPSGSTFTIPAVPLRDAGQYIVTAWWQKVPYWFSFKGREMVADTLTIHVFDTTDSLQDVAITGLTLVAQRQGDSLKLEYLLEIQNSSSPQQTILGRDFTLAMAAPGGLEEPDASYSRGPDPTPITTTRIHGGQLGLAVPLTWGKNTIRLVGRVPWDEGLNLPVGFNIPLETWSLLVSPDWVQVNAMGLDPDPSAAFKGYGRFRGPAIDADRELAVRLTSGEHQEGTMGKIFTSDADSGAENEATPAPESQKSSGGLPMPLILVLALIALILLFVASRKARS